MINYVKAVKGLSIFLTVSLILNGVLATALIIKCLQKPEIKVEKTVLLPTDLPDLEPIEEI